MLFVLEPFISFSMSHDGRNCDCIMYHTSVTLNITLHPLSKSKIKKSKMKTKNKIKGKKQKIKIKEKENK